MATRVSKNFTLEELYASDTAARLRISNVPNQQAICSLCALAHNVLQPLRDYAKKAIQLNSGYRCAALNKAVGGVSNSQHMLGEAADINIGGDLTQGKKWFEWIKTHCEYDQLIWEHNAAGEYWIHVSFRADGNNRKQVIDNLLKK